MTKLNYLNGHFLLDFFKMIALLVVLSVTSLLFELITYSHVFVPLEFPIIPTNYSNLLFLLIKHLVIGTAIATVLLCTSQKSGLKKLIIYVELGLLFTATLLVFPPQNVRLINGDGLMAPLVLIVAIIFLEAAIVVVPSLTIILFILEQVRKQKLSLLLFALTLISLTAPIFLSWNYSLQRKLQLSAPLVYANTPHNHDQIFDNEVSPPASWLTHPKFVRDERWTALYRDIEREKFSSEKWLDTCKNYQQGSAGFDLFGSNFANRCFQLGAYAYEDRAMCDWAGNLASQCLEDFNKKHTIKQLTSPTTASGVIAQTKEVQVIDCDSLKNDADAAAPIYGYSMNNSVSDYTRCLMEHEIKGIEPIIKPLESKFQVVDCELNLLERNKSFISLKNKSTDTLSTADITVTLKSEHGFVNGRDVGMLETKKILPQATEKLAILEKSTSTIQMENRGKQWLMLLYHNLYIGEIDNITKCSIAAAIHS